MVVRHGARYYPTTDEADKFQLLENVQALINDSNAEMCSEDLEVRLSACTACCSLIEYRKRFCVGNSVVDC